MSAASLASGWVRNVLLLLALVTSLGPLGACDRRNVVFNPKGRLGGIGPYNELCETHDDCSHKQLCLEDLQNPEVKRCQWECFSLFDCPNICTDGAFCNGGQCGGMGCN